MPADFFRGGIVTLPGCKAAKNESINSSAIATSISYDSPRRTESNELGEKEKPIIEELEENNEMTDEEVTAYVNSSSILDLINKYNSDSFDASAIVEELEAQNDIKFSESVALDTRHLLNMVRTLVFTNPDNDMKLSCAHPSTIDNVVRDIACQRKYTPNYVCYNYDSMIDYNSSNFTFYELPDGVDPLQFEATKMPNELSGLLNYHRYYDEKGIGNNSNSIDIDMACKRYIMYADKAFKLAIEDAKGKYTADDFGFKQIEDTDSDDDSDYGYEEAGTATEDGEWIEYDDIRTGEHVKEFVPYER